MLVEGWMFLATGLPLLPCLDMRVDRRRVGGRVDVGFGKDLVERLEPGRIQRLLQDTFTHGRVGRAVCRTDEALSLLAHIPSVSIADGDQAHMRGLEGLRNLFRQLYLC